MTNYSTHAAPDNSQKGFWLHFYAKNATEWLDYGLPTPHYIQPTNHGSAFVAWLIEGYFGTRKGKEYLNDVIARLTVALAAERLPYAPHIEARRASAHIHDAPPVTLKQFDALREQVERKARELWPRRAESFADFTFWAIKLWVEDWIGEHGEGAVLPYPALENWALNQFLGHKERSTIRAKCRSVWNWYDEREWTIPKRRGGTMGTREAALHAAATKADRARKAVEDAITGLMAEAYKKKNGKWNANKIAEATGLHPETVRKYLKELTQNG